jgi:uncharacterized membrane protein YecN with MAPEG domain
LSAIGAKLDAQRGGGNAARFTPRFILTLALMAMLAAVPFISAALGNTYLVTVMTRS